MDNIPRVKGQGGGRNAIIVDMCPYCGQAHYHGGGGAVPVEIKGMRVADCGGGQYELIEYTKEEEKADYES